MLKRLEELQADGDSSGGAPEPDGDATIPADRSIVRRANFTLERLDIPEPVAQEFQRIKSYVLMAAEEGPLKTIAVTAATEGRPDEATP